jgi:hypothetical protein
MEGQKDLPVKPIRNLSSQTVRLERKAKGHVWREAQFDTRFLLALQLG